MKHVHAETNGKIIVIDGREFIAPKSFKPMRGQAYWYFTVCNKSTFYTTNEGVNFDEAAINLGRCYRTEEEAEQALKFWLTINEV